MATKILKIQVFSKDWERKALRAIDQKKPLELVLKGPQAQMAGEAIKRSLPPTGVRQLVDPITPGVLITATIVMGVIAVVGLGVIAAVSMYGISKGYKVYVKHKINGPWPMDDELILKLTPM